MNTLNRSRAVAAVAAVVLVAGCATPKQVAKEIVDSNRAQELAENQLLLLNILRAMHREPMHFTLVTSVHMPVGLGTPTLGLSIPFPGGSVANPISATTGTTISQSVDITALNTQEFMRGITKPMALDTMAYYIDQGWPREMILALFVRTVDIPADMDPTPPTVCDLPRPAGDMRLPNHYENYPGSWNHFNQFEQVIGLLARCSIQVDSDESTFGPPLEEWRIQDVKALTEMRAASMAFTASSPRPGQYQLTIPPKDSHLTLGSLPTVKDKRQPVCPWTHATASVAGKNPAGQEAHDLVIQLRSPEAMIYFLGEIAREQLEPPTHDESCKIPLSAASAPAIDASGPSLNYASADQKRPGSKERYQLLSITHDVGPDTCYVEVDYESQHYCVPRYHYDNRSTQTLSLMHQLITLQNKGTDLPTTSTVRVVP